MTHPYPGLLRILDGRKAKLELLSRHTNRRSPIDQGKISVLEKPTGTILPLFASIFIALRYNCLWIRQAADNLEQAIAHAEHALDVYTRQVYPEQWAIFVRAIFVNYPGVLKPHFIDGMFI